MANFCLFACSLLTFLSGLLGLRAGAATTTTCVSSVVPRGIGGSSHSPAPLSSLLGDSSLIVEARLDPNSRAFRPDRVLKGTKILLRRKHHIFLREESPLCGGRPEKAAAGGGRSLRGGLNYFLFLREDAQGGLVALEKPRPKSKKLLKAILCGVRGPQIQKVSANSSSGKVKEGHRLRLKCKISCGSHGKTEIFWLKNGRRLRSTSRLKIKRRSSRGRGLRGSVLLISRVKRADRGRYECVVSSGGKPAKISLRVRVEEKKRLLKYFDSKRFLRGSLCPLSSYCLNGGKCVYYRGLGELTCICATGFKGKRCEHKDLYDRAVSLNTNPGLICVLGLTHFPC